MNARRMGVLFAVVVGCIAAATAGGAASSAVSATGCQLQSAKGAIKHVIYIQFDNTHFRRDSATVLSDLEQMPALKNFIESNGTMLNKQYTVLISHTAGGILSSLTGLYPDRMGTTVSNSYDYYNPSTGKAINTSDFKYWTAKVAPGVDDNPNMVNADSGTPKTAPAPWVSYTRAGCDVGNVSVANTVLENNSISTGGDICNVYGCPSPEASESATLRMADFVGIAVHCADATSSVCNNTYGAPHAKADPLPDEPNGYVGFKALLGAKYVDPAITGGNACVNDVFGTTQVKDPGGNCGFPGFDSMTAANTLGYVAQMQEAGIPITYAYISDAHDNHSGFGAYGPGEAGYVAALKTYNDAFSKFFTRLAADGIDKSNTLFVFTADENDHFAGQDPNAAPFSENCNGDTTMCTYNTTPGLALGGKPQHGIFDVTNGGVTPWTGPTTWPPSPAPNGPLVGEVGYNIKWSALMGPTTNGAGYDTSFDSAPSFYIDGAAQVGGQPSAVDSSGNVVLNTTLRAFEQKAGALKAFDPYVDASQLIPVANFLVDAPTLRAIHMINADPQRTMPFTMFSVPDFYFQTFSPCPSPSQGCVNDSFAWIHGDYSNDIGQTWLGVVGPGVKAGGLDDTTWTDHTDIVPTVMSLVGLKTDYVPDGRVISQILTPSVAKGMNGKSFTDLGDMYKQLDAPYGDFAHSVIVASTKGIKADDPTYLATENSIKSLTSERDALVLQMRDVLTGASNGHQEQLIRQGQDLLKRAATLAAS